MQVKHSFYEYSQILHGNDVVTSIYVLLFIIFLNYNNLLLKVWSFDNIYIIIILAAAEVTKYIIHATRDSSSVHRHSVKDLFMISLMLTSVFGIVYVIAILFGAPVFSMFEETFIFSVIVTTVTALPVGLHLGPKAAVNMFLSLTSYDSDNIHNLFMLKIRLSLFGAWLGAIVIPLDWNRPWQNWPIPCCIGTLLGYAVANVITSLLQFQQRGKLLKKAGKYIL
ncbi:PIG-F domain containing protein [Asbolus verrucosus]|uniref:PIG-F domain containing protein n=1 Tax=Asbolus verrucosus TaxID=1661398 RepID=A0A482V7B4_ASBVE|nr:PIG-F domain containing protein [Asbolus verrucosus]